VTRRDPWLAGVALGVMGATALFLASWRTLQQLGEPGVRVVAEELPVIEPQPGGTNRLVGVLSNSVALPARVLNYQSEPMPLQRMVYDWLPRDTTYGQRMYRAPDGFRIQNLVVLMGSDRTSIHQPQYCLTGSGWAIRSAEKTSVRIERPHPYDLPVMKLRMSGQFRVDGGRLTELSGVFVYWFVADGALSNDHRQRMWWMARDLVTRGTLQRWAYVICFAACLPGHEESTFDRLQQFMQASVPEYQLTPRPDDAGRRSEAQGQSLGAQPDGASRRTPRALRREASVDGLTPRRAAAPRGPAILP
jgi:hypothetical protein